MEIYGSVQVLLLSNMQYMFSHVFHGKSCSPVLFCLRLLTYRETYIKAGVKSTPKIKIYGNIMFLLASQRGDWDVLCNIIVKIGVDFTTSL